MTRPHARRLPRSSISGVLALATLLLVGGGVAMAATRTVTIADFAFSPRTITINAGDRVTWTNSDQVAHTATARNGSFDTGNIGAGGSRSVRFNVPGTYRYICTPHPTMTGTITVRATSGGSGLPATDTIEPLSPVGAAADAGVGPWLIGAGAALFVAFAVVRRRRPA